MGSIRLASSGIDGSRHPFRPPTFLLIQVEMANAHVAVVVAGDCSHTSPVFLSSTASLAKAASTTNRVAYGLLVSHRRVWLPVPALAKLAMAARI